MTSCSIYWRALNEADEKLAALESMLAGGTAPVDELRKPQEAFIAARDEYIRLCEEGVQLPDGRRVWGPDLLAMLCLEQKNKIMHDIPKRITLLDDKGRIVGLDLAWCDISTLKPLSGLRLEMLEVQGNGNLRDLSGLEGMSTLRGLEAWSCNLTTLISLRGLSLEDLQVDGNKELKNLGGLEGMATLKRLRAVGCGLNTLQALKGLGIEKLALCGNNGLTSLSGLDGMATLRLLTATDCGLSTEEVARWQKVYPFGSFK